MAMYKWLWTSAAEDMAMKRNWVNSLLDRLTKPSAMFAMTEPAAAWIWPDNLRSLLKAGLFVAEYTMLVSFRASCQHSRSSKRVSFMMVCLVGLVDLVDLVDLVCLVYLVHLVCLVCLVCLVGLVGLADGSWLMADG